MTKPNLTGADFQRQVGQLWQLTKGKPKDPTVCTLPSPDEDGHNEFPLAVEIELTESIAYIAAVKKGVESVSASAMSIPNDSRSELLIYVASNDGIQPKARKHLTMIFSAIEQSAKSGGSDRSSLRDRIREIVLNMNSNRIKVRLKTCRGNRPIVLDGLQEMLRPIRQKALKDHSLQPLVDRLSALCVSIQTHTIQSKSATSIEHDKCLVLACFDFWNSRGNRSTREMLRQVGVNTDESRGDPHLRQIAKIAAYENVSLTLAMHALNSRYRRLFRHITVHFVTPHDPIPVVSPITGAAGHDRYRVHAEVQLVMDIDLTDRQRWKPPRTIGSSKAACFLCDLFVRTHKTYLVRKSHGILSRYWAVPDLDRFTRAQRRRYQQIIKAMTVELLRLTNIPHPVRADPAMSWQTLSLLGRLRLSAQSSKLPIPVQSALLPSAASPITPELAVPPQSAAMPVDYVSQSKPSRVQLESSLDCEPQSEPEPPHKMKAITGRRLQAGTSPPGFPDAGLSSRAREKAAINQELDCQELGRQSNKACTINNELVEDQTCKRVSMTSNLVFDVKDKDGQMGIAITNCICKENAGIPAKFITNLQHCSQFYPSYRVNDGIPQCLSEPILVEHTEPTSAISEISDLNTDPDMLEAQQQARSFDDHDIKDHESRACEVSIMHDARNKEFCNRALCMVDTCRKIDFHELELFLEFERPTAVKMRIELSEAPHASDSQVIDVHALEHGQYHIVEFISENMGERILYLGTSQKSGRRKWLKLNW